MDLGGIRMVLRSTCLCNGIIIGIESIFTVVDGMQINIPQKVEELREKSRRNELFCPCGCGANLVLVAGDKNIRHQHFRMRDANKEDCCQYASEGPVSIDSKIVLKCWMEDKLSGAEVNTRVPICCVGNNDRKYEISLLSQVKHVAISYFFNRSNLSDEKINTLEKNTSKIKMHYIVDVQNTGNNMQYPEMMMKIQKNQGYCLFLEVVWGSNGLPEYLKTKLHVRVYHKNKREYWQEANVLSDQLNTFSFGDQGELLYKNNPVLVFVERKMQEYLQELHQKEIKQANAEAERMRLLEQQKQEEERKRQEWKEQYKRELEAQKEKEKRAIARKAAEKRVVKELKLKKIESEIDLDQEKIFIDSDGIRWVRCKYCGKVDFENEFTFYGGYHHVNLGMCRVCSESPEKEVLPQYQLVTKTIKEPMTEQRDCVTLCPSCGGRLVERMGRYGHFIGCSNFPSCKFTKNI